MPTPPILMAWGCFQVDAPFALNGALDTVPASEARRQRRKRWPQSGPSLSLGGLSVLVEAGLHQLRRPGGPDLYLVTSGGAYAALPYVYQGGVDQYGWLTGQQMIDGLALGETTPGPLIMVVAFVGFVGGWTKEIFGPDSRVLAGITGAIVAALFTFPPSFLIYPDRRSSGGGDTARPC